MSEVIVEDEQKRLTSWPKKILKMWLREPKDKKELTEILREAYARSLIDTESFAMIEGALQVSSLKIKDIMVPRTQMTILEKNMTLSQLLPIIVQSGHSRFPVIGEDRDEILGVLLAKDLLKYFLNRDHEPFEISDILRTPIFVPESKRVDKLLRDFRLSHNHIALVVDEYGGISGLVTIEDILEQIVGEIEDEYDTVEEPFIKKHSNDLYIIKAITPIDVFNEYFQENFSDDEFDTMGGYLIKHFGYLPKRNDVIKIGQYRFKILLADSRQIKLIQLRIRPEK